MIFPMPLFRDISHDTKETYTLTEGEQCVFFLLNRPGSITFTLTGKDAAAHVVAIYTIHNHDTLTGSITQVHQSPETTSSFIGRSILFDSAHLDWQGLVRIEEKAVRSEGRQEIHSLLLSPHTTVHAIPSLEIANDDVRCGHAATTKGSTLLSQQSRSLTYTSDPSAYRRLPERCSRETPDRCRPKKPPAYASPSLIPK